MPLDFSTFQDAGFAEQAVINAINLKGLDDGASPTLTPESSCGELESCDSASATGKGRPLPAWLRNGASTMCASKDNGRAKHGCRLATSCQPRCQPSAIMPVRLTAQTAPKTDCYAALRARGEHVRTCMAHGQRPVFAAQSAGPKMSRRAELQAHGEQVRTSMAQGPPPVSSRRSQLRTLAEPFLPTPPEQDLYGLHHQSGLWSELEIDALEARAAVIQEEPGTMIGTMSDNAATYAAFQDGWHYECGPQSDAADLQSDAVALDMPMKVHVECLSTFADQATSAEGWTI